MEGSPKLPSKWKEARNCRPNGRKPETAVQIEGSPKLPSKWKEARNCRPNGRKPETAVQMEGSPRGIASQRIHKWDSFSEDNDTESPVNAFVITLKHSGKKDSIKMPHLLLATLMSLLFAASVTAEGEQFLTNDKIFGNSDDEVGYPGQCDPPFRATAGGHCYFLSHGVITQTWQYAKEICAWLHPQGALAEFQTPDELAEITALLNGEDSSCGSWEGGGPWIGGREVGDTNVFVWDSTNTTIEYTNWADSEPDSDTANDGIAMACPFECKSHSQNVNPYLSQLKPVIFISLSSPTISTDEWIDLNSDTLMPFLCEAPPNPPPITFVCPDNFFLLGGSCYSIGTDILLNWDESQIYCSSVTAGGKLVEFENWEEYDTLVNYLMEQGICETLWIGAEEVRDTRSYKWRSSQKLVTFYNWWYLRPSEGGSDSGIDINCVNSYQWGDVPKGEERYQLCEVLPTETNDRV
ncbi:unnamed protein product [Cyprideis torosa]|uniref:Uncharacterized protein n=1 Tax=Cyprideis torosa TaxID=163714 RepID=A0A7R8WCW4_9CRUS|nr:unnamed protein product [Cyprideis torosa]CAG0892456.1 unnamed protein product [Cyprideis torosa]